MCLGGLYIFMANNDRFDFNWDSFYTVSNNQKYEIINEVRRLDGTEDLEVLENLKTEWTKVQTTR